MNTRIVLFNNGKYAIQVYRKPVVLFGITVLKEWVKGYRSKYFIDNIWNTQGRIEDFCLFDSKEEAESFCEKVTLKVIRTFK